MKNDDDFFCVNPFIGFEIKTDGYVSPCCKFQTSVYKNENYITNSSVNEIINSGDFQQLKENMLKGIPHEGCKFCYYDESNGITSKRQRDNNTFSELIPEIKSNNYNQIKIVDLKLGNVCNLKCVICSESASSKWYEEKLRWGGPKREKIKDYNKKFRWHKQTEFWDCLNTTTDTIQEISIFGGEPFLIQEQFDFVDTLIESGHSKNINLSYSTNGTIFPSDNLLRMSEKFKTLNIMLSIDGIEDTFEYCRFPAKWPEVEKNIHLFKGLPRINLGISYSVSLFSVFNLGQSLKYYKNINQPVWINMVHDDSSIRQLPDDLKQKAIESISAIQDDVNDILIEKNLNGIIDYIKLKPTVDFNSKMETIKHSDVYRKVNICDIIPEMKKYYE